jgi:hypothetical protein
VTASLLAARHPQREAAVIAGDGYDVRVLEPSPPAVHDDNLFADDPVRDAAANGARARPVLRPVAGADLTWSEWLTDNLDHCGWAADRWLGAYQRLGPLPAEFVETRLALHRIAAYVVSPARRRVNGKIALRWTLGGVGTPFFGDDEQVRIVGPHLVRQRGDAADAQPLTSLAEAAAFALDGEPDIVWADGFDVPDPGDVNASLNIDPGAAAFLGDWFGFAWSVLEEIRADAASTDPSRVQLWPEHFDAAFDCLAPAHRATLGASPGDHAVVEPYLYVISPVLTEEPASVAWNATSFRGAILTFEELERADDQRSTAIEFFRSRRDLLVIR